MVTVDDEGIVELAWPREKLSANVSMLYADLPLLDRPAAAARAGFACVESWWPFDDPAPPSTVITRFVDSFRRAGVETVSLNFFTGDRERKERGLPAVAGGVSRFAANVPIALDVAERIGARVMNVLYGNVDPDETAGMQLRRAARAIADAAKAAEDRNIHVMIEPISAYEAPDYALRTVADVRRVIEAVAETGGPSVGVCFDIYHLAQSESDLCRVATENVSVISHVQVADLPGRGAPGTGRLAIDRVLRHLGAAGYRGCVGLEYRPNSTDATTSSPTSARTAHGCVCTDREVS